MDAEPRQQLEERVAKEVQTMLTEGDRLYLQGLSRASLIEAVETELRFLGLYSHDDQETPLLIHELIKKHIDQWRVEYLWQGELSTSESKVEITSSPFILTSFNTTTGISITEETHYIGFTAPIERLSVQFSSMQE